MARCRHLFQVGKAESDEDAADEAQDRTLDLDEFVEAMVTGIRLAPFVAHLHHRHDCTDRGC